MFIIVRSPCPRLVITSVQSGSITMHVLHQCALPAATTLRSQCVQQVRPPPVTRASERFKVEQDRRMLYAPNVIASAISSSQDTDAVVSTTPQQRVRPSTPVATHHPHAISIIKQYARIPRRMERLCGLRQLYILLSTPGSDLTSVSNHELLAQ